MTRDSLWKGLAVAAVLGAGGCDQLGLGPEQAVSAPAAPEAAVPSTVTPAALRAAVGEGYSGFAAGAGASYAPEALGLSAADRARLWRAMAIHRVGELISGGGAEALVFRGCAEGGCADGASIVAIDTATGGAFIGVHDVGGADILTPNDRVEALLRLNSPTRGWDDPAPTTQTAETAPAEAARP